MYSLETNAEETIQNIKTWITEVYSSTDLEFRTFHPREANLFIQQAKDGLNLIRYRYLKIVPIGIKSYRFTYSFPLLGPAYQQKMLIKFMRMQRSEWRSLIASMETPPSPCSLESVESRESTFRFPLVLLRNQMKIYCMTDFPKLPQPICESVFSLWPPWSGVPV